MKKRIALASVASIAFFISSCNKSTSGNQNASGSSITGVSYATVKINKLATAIPKSTSYTSLTVDLKCPGALPGGADWSNVGVVVDGSNSSFQLIQGVACTVTLKNYVDASNPVNSFVPAKAPLVLSISANGMAAKVTDAILYSKTPEDTNVWYFAAGTTSPYSIVLNYGNDPVNVVVPIQNIITQNVGVVAGPGATAPTLTGIQLSKVTNNGGSVDYSLFGIVTGSTDCMMFPLSSLTAFDYNTMNAAFNGTSGTACPVNILDGSQGNWDAFVGDAQVVVWGNIVAGVEFNGYTYITIPANP